MSILFYNDNKIDKNGHQASPANPETSSRNTLRVGLQDAATVDTGILDGNL